MHKYSKAAVVALLLGSASSVKLSHRSRDPAIQDMINGAVMDAAASKSPDVAKLYPSDQDIKEQKEA